MSLPVGLLHVTQEQIAAVQPKRQGVEHGQWKIVKSAVNSGVESVVVLAGDLLPGGNVSGVCS
jgi:hypothetical protein